MSLSHLPPLSPSCSSMLLIRHPDLESAEGTPSAVRGSVLALGNFDGVHRGHQAVLSVARDKADQLGVPLTVMSFEPHPRAFFRPNHEPFRLTPLRIKARLLDAMGTNIFFVQHFDESLAAMTASAFIRSVLVEQLAVRHVVVGYDYVFGHNRQGTGATLQRAADDGAFGFSAVPPATTQTGAVYSSTTIRRLLSEGRPTDAAYLLGHYWEVEARVEHGDRRGTELGFATANMHLGDYHRPARGVYAVRAGVDHGGQTQWLDAVANYGVRPTFDGQDERLEVHLLDHHPDLYDQHLRVALVAFIRPEMRFTSVDALKSQIVSDIAAARLQLAAHPFPEHIGPFVPVNDTPSPCGS